MADIRLRRTTAEDLPFVLAAEAVPENRAWILPWSHEQHLASLGDADLDHRILESTGDPERVGFVLLAGLASPHDSVELRRIVVTRKRQGHGRAAVQAVKHYAFEQLKAHRLWLDVKEQNRIAVRLYRSEGFTPEGVLRECLRGENGYESLVVMSMLVSEYRRSTGPGA